MKQATKLSVVVLSALLVSATSFAQQKADPQVMRGRYLVEIAGCNDCHTPGYAMSGGKVPESQWLTGDALGKTLETRPPMPWFNLRAMSNADLRATYRYIRHLGPAGAAGKVSLGYGKAA
jgi:mono/diheme cytochrome c family protein